MSSGKPNKKKGSKSRVNQFTPNNKYSQIQKFKSINKPGLEDPTVETFSDVLSSDDIHYDLPQDQYDYERPSEKGFSFEGFWKPLIITITTAIILGIGGWILSHEIKIALLEQKIETHDKEIDKANVKNESLNNEIENIKSEQKLEKYKIEELEKKKK